MANILHYASPKGKRAWKSILAAGLLAWMEAHGMEYATAHTRSDTITRRIDLILYTDSSSLHGLFISLSYISERRLRIDLLVIRQVHEQRVITALI